MPKPLLKSLKNNKRFLLNAFQDNRGKRYSSIKTFRRNNPEFTSDEEAYAFLFFMYNNIIETQNADEAEQERIRNNVMLIIPSISELKRELSRRINTTVRVEYIGDDGFVHRSHTYTPAEPFNRWWRDTGVYIDFQEKSENMIWDNFPDGKLVIYSDTLQNVKPGRIIQVFREGITNCMLTPIRLWLDDKCENAASVRTKQRYVKMRRDVDELLIKYKDGVPENEVPNICETLQVGITVSMPFADTPVIECSSTRQALTRFTFQNIRNDHVELNEIINIGNQIQTTQIELYKLAERLDNEKTYYQFKKNNCGLCSISTSTATYTCVSDYYTTVNDFEDKHQLKDCRLDDIHNPEISEFVRSGCHFGQTVDFKPELVNSLSMVNGRDDWTFVFNPELGFNQETDETYSLHCLSSNNLNQSIYVDEPLYHIDQKKAYTNSKLCKYYNGFLGKITDFRQTDKIEGVGLYMITNLQFQENAFKAYNDKMIMYVDDNIYTDAELNMLRDNGVTFDILGGCWGVTPLDLVFTDDMINSSLNGVSYYARYVGAAYSKRLTASNWIKGDEAFANLLRTHCPEKTVRHYCDGEIQIEYKLDNAPHLSHLTAFITAYMRLNVIEQLLTMDINNIVRVCVDGIYYQGDKVVTHNAFRDKNEYKFGNVASETYCSNLIERRTFDWGNPRVHNKTELHLGEGGCGKTHSNLMDKGLHRVLYLAPSHKLARAKRNEMGIHSNVWANAISIDPQKTAIIKKYGVVVWDEVSMMTDEMKEFIFKTYPNMKHIFCGDIGYQLPPFSVDPNEIIYPITATGFDAIIHHTNDYRCNCPILKEIKVQLRRMIEKKHTLKSINLWVMQRFRECNRVITINRLKELYTNSDMILVGTKSMRTRYTDMFKGTFPSEKYYITTNGANYCNGDIVVATEPPSGVTSEIRHAYTTHSIQGETAQCSLFIDASRMFDVRMFYTAISRAKKLDQIYIIEEDEE